MRFGPNGRRRRSAIIEVGDNLMLAAGTKSKSLAMSSTGCWTERFGGPRRARAIGTEPRRPKTSSHRAQVRGLMYCQHRPGAIHNVPYLLGVTFAQPAYLSVPYFTNSSGKCIDNTPGAAVIFYTFISLFEHDLIPCWSREN